MVCDVNNVHVVKARHRAHVIQQYFFDFRFDRTLRQQNSDWGYRDVKELIRLAEMNNLCLEESHEMPANNKLLVWKKS